ncbi:MAG: type II toxin-antitoxin system VapC family toxin [Candidatus Poribacteria bacterium]
MSIFSFDATPPELSYGDPSFFIGALFKEDDYHRECRQFAEKLKAAQSLVALSPLGLDEIWFAVLKLLATRDFSERAWQRALKNDPDLVKGYVPIIEQTHEELLALPYIVVIDAPTQHVLDGLEVMKSYGLFPRDAIHVSITKLSGITNLITTNRDYARVPEINVYTCNPEALKLIEPPSS